MDATDSRLSQDPAGQWWYKSGRTNRCRVYERSCDQCGREFIARRRQRLCSGGCRVALITGKPKTSRAERACPWCGTLFVPSRSELVTCSRKCGYERGNSLRGSPGPRNGNWKGGRANHAAGYVMEWVPERGHLLQHRVVMERVLGRRLEPGENVRHKNGDRSDNRPDNLELWRIKQPPGQRADEQKHCPTCTCDA